MENNLTPFFSVCIPVWGIEGKGVDYLEYSLNILAHQYFKDFEVVISDHSTDEYLKECCDEWSDLLNINYVKCETGRGKISPNLNNAIRNCKGKYIKILFQDDFLYDEYSLSTIHAFIQNNDTNWLLTGCAHTKDMISIYDVMVPHYHDRIYEGINTISCPTVLTIKNTDDKLYFNEDLNWLMDVEYYKRLFDKHGSPDIMPHIGVINRQAEVRATNLISEEQKQEEIKLLSNTFSNKINLPSVTLIAVTSVRLEEHIKALEYSSRGINFGAIKIISDIAPSVLPAGITHEYISKISNIDEWSYNIIYKLGDYIDTDYAMLIHDDGFIINPTSWREDFLKYDYIGAPWPIPNDNISYRDINGDLIRVGNSVSLRSKKLIDLPNKIKLEWKPFHGYYNEDGFICVNYRHEYIKHGCKFADINIAKYFSHENELPETKDIVPFAFHGKNKYKL